MKIELFFFILFLLLAPASLVGVVIFSQKIMYIPLAVCVLGAIVSIIALPVTYHKYKTK